MKQRVKPRRTSRKSGRGKRGRMPTFLFGQKASNGTAPVHIPGNNRLERIFDEAYPTIMVAPKSKADKAAEFLSEVSVEDWDQLLRALTGKWETAFANRQMQAKREGVTTPPPAPPRVDSEFEFSTPKKRVTETGAVLTIENLIDSYLTDPKSSFQELRHATKSNYLNLSKRLRNSCGNEKLADLKSADLHRLYEGWTSSTIPIGNAIMTTLRLIISYGAGVLKDEECERLVGALRHFKFKTPARVDSEPLTVDQAIAIRAKVKEIDWQAPSIALAQALQFDCGLRQKDIIGEWVPEVEKGESDVVADGKKWIAGIRWEEIDRDFVLSHVTSYQQKRVEVDLKIAAMVVEELDAKYPGFLSDRSLLPATGPVIVCEKTKKPWTDVAYRRLWRLIATEVGVPVTVKKMSKRRPSKKGFEINETAETEAPAVRH